MNDPTTITWGPTTTTNSPTTVKYLYLHATAVGVHDQLLQAYACRTSGTGQGSTQCIVARSVAILVDSEDGYSYGPFYTTLVITIIWSME